MSPFADGPVVAFVQTADRARAEAFYRDALGLPFVGFDGFGSVFTLAGGQLRVTEIAGYAPPPHPALGWDVADIAAALARLKAAGVRPEIYDGMGQDADGVWTAPDGSARVAWFKDPDGNLLSMVQR